VNKMGELHAPIDGAVLVVRGQMDSSDAGPATDAVQRWLTARLSEAPPLTTEQLQRLQQLLGFEQATELRSA
jgi:hypothetical protein